MPETKILAPTPEGIAQAAGMLCKSALVAFPTETVYGLGADATDNHAVARVFEAKGRPTFNPLIAHVPTLEAAQQLAAFSETAITLAEAFWPGPLTLVLPLKHGSGISHLVTAGGDKIAVRVPKGDIAQRLLRATGRPVAAPSANPSGRISPTNATHVIRGLSGKIEAVLDGGPCAVGVESTIVGFEQTAHVLRDGGVPNEALEACLGKPLNKAPETDTPTAPGQLASHYAPNARVRLNAKAANEGEILIGFGATDGDLSLSPSGNLVEAAANLFAVLHMADADGRPIAVVPIPEHGLGRAINDRLRRAAAPRT